ncbi:MAG: GNAT family N-acetyltransferase, partial [Flavobacteriaceae bacterium]
MTVIEAHIEHLDLLAPLFDAYRVFYEQPSDLKAART